MPKSRARIYKPPCPAVFRWVPIPQNKTPKTKPQIIMKKIFTLFMFAVISLTASAYTGTACFSAWYETYGYFDQEWTKEGNTYTFKDFLFSGFDLVATITDEGTPAEGGGTQYSVALSAPGSASYENGGYFYFCGDNAANFAALYPGIFTEYLVMAAYSPFCSLVIDDPVYGSYLSIGAYWDTAYSKWDYIYIYLTGDDDTAVKNASVSLQPAAGKFLSNGRVVVRRGNSLFDTAGKLLK